MDSLDEWKKNRVSEEIDICDVRVGMDVYVIFMPYSQKYIMDPVWGRVVHADGEDIKVRVEGKTEDLLRPGCHFFCMNLGYDYTIYRLL